MTFEEYVENRWVPYGLKYMHCPDHKTVFDPDDEICEECYAEYVEETDESNC